MGKRIKRWAGWALVWSRAWQAARWSPPGDVLFSVTLGVGQGEDGGPALRGFFSLCVVHGVADLEPGRPWREVREALDRTVLALRDEHERHHARLATRLAAAGNLKGGDGGHC